jgi:hypothetical protein
VGLYRAAACRRLDRLSQGQEQGIARFIVRVRRAADPDDTARCFSAGLRAGIGERDAGRAAAGVRGAAGQDEEIHAERFDFGGDGGGAGVVEFEIPLTSHRCCTRKMIARMDFRA